MHSLTLVLGQELLSFFGTQFVRIVVLNRRKMANIGLIFFLVEEMREVAFLYFCKTKGFW